MADLKVEIIEFVRPDKNEVNLYVTNISNRLDKDMVQIKLLEIFSQFGLVYEVQVIDSSENIEGLEEAPVKTTSRTNCSMYAFVKYYSANAAARAKEQTSGKRLLDGQFLKVQYALRKKVIDTCYPLYMAKCTELANYYFGFDGWSTRIVQMDRIGDEEIGHFQDIHHATFRCIVRLEIKGYDFFCDGIGYGGDKNVLLQEKDPSKRLELLSYASKLAHRHSYENAFRRVIIVSLDNGKVGVEIDQRNIPDCSWNEHDKEGMVHVNQIDDTPVSDSDEEDNELSQCIVGIVSKQTAAGAASVGN